MINESDITEAIAAEMGSGSPPEFTTEDRIFVLRQVTPKLLGFLQTLLSDLDDPKYENFRSSLVDLHDVKSMYKSLWITWEFPYMGEDFSH